MRHPVLTRTPYSARHAHNARVIEFAPPRGIGQPTACNAAPSSTPEAELNGSLRLRNECAAIPAKSALTRSDLNCARASLFAGRNAFSPNLAISRGCVGIRGMG